MQIKIKLVVDVTQISYFLPHSKPHSLGRCVCWFYWEMELLSLPTMCVIQCVVLCHIELNTHPASLSSLLSFHKTNVFYRFCRIRKTS